MCDWNRCGVLGVVPMTTTFVFMLFMSTYRGGLMEVPRQPENMSMERCELLRQYTKDRTLTDSGVFFHCVPVVKEVQVNG